MSRILGWHGWSRLGLMPLRWDGLLFGITWVAATVLTIGSLITFEGQPAALLAVAFLTALSVGLVWKYITQQRMAPYALAQGSLREVARHLSDAAYHDDPAAAKAAIQNAINRMGDAFRIVTGAPCRVLLLNRRDRVGDDLDVWIFSGATQGNAADPEEPSPPEVFRIQGSTRFEEVLTKQSTFWTNDAVGQRKQNHYQDSAWPTSGLNPGKVAYRSTIVAPVRTTVGRATVDTPDYSVFLCVDTLLVDAFHQADVFMTDSFAWQLYPVVHKLQMGMAVTQVPMPAAPTPAAPSTQSSLILDATRSWLLREPPEPPKPND